LLNSSGTTSYQRNSFVALILIVDDTETEQARMSGLLSGQSDHTVRAVGSAAAALEEVEADSIDLVVTDLRMPEMTGIELIEKLQKSHPRLPVILMSSCGSEEETVEAIRQGAAGYLNKSHAAPELLPLVERLLTARATDLAHAEILRRREIDEYHFCLPSRRSFMSATAAFLRQRIQAAELCPDKELLRLGIAIEEALLNGCLHGNLDLDSALREEGGDQFEALADKRSQLSPWKDRSVYVTASVTPQQAQIIVRDEGDGFDPGDLPDPTDPENLLKPHGRGVMIMKMFLNEVIWNDRGNEVTLVMNAYRAKDASE